MVENINMYQKKEMDENVNMRQKAKSIIPKVILKQPNLEIIEEDQEEADIDLRRDLNPYQYNVVDDFRQTSINIFFRDLMRIGLYYESIQ